MLHPALWTSCTDNSVLPPPCCFISLQHHSTQTSPTHKSHDSAAVVCVFIYEPLCLIRQRYGNLTHWRVGKGNICIAVVTRCGTYCSTCVCQCIHNHILMYIFTYLWSTKDICKSQIRDRDYGFLSFVCIIQCLSSECCSQSHLSAAVCTEARRAQQTCSVSEGLCTWRTGHDDWVNWEPVSPASQFHTSLFYSNTIMYRSQTE